MIAHVTELSSVLSQMHAAHQTLLTQLEQQHVAMRTCNADAIERAARSQEQTRQKLISLEGKRRTLLLQLARQHKKPSLTLSQIAELYPPQSASLLQQRQQLREIMEHVRSRSAVVSKVASAVLGQMNQLVRIVTEAASGPSIYLRPGQAPQTPRMNALNAVA